MSLTEPTRDAQAINRVANHPDVIGGLCLGLASLDVTDFLKNPRNLAFLGEHGGAVMQWSAPGVYEAHDFILPEGRGKWARDACLEILNRMFADFGARMVWAQTPVEHRACRLFNRMLGFVSRGLDKAALLPGKPMFDVEVFAMEVAPCR